MKDYKTIYLNSEEDIASIIDRLAATEVKNIILVFPANSNIFSSIINLQLLRREAVNEEKVICIATADKVGRQLAERVGIPLVDDLEEERAVGGNVVDQEKPSISKPISRPEVHRVASRAGEVVDLKRQAAPKRAMDIVAPGKRVVSLKKEAGEAASGPALVKPVSAKKPALTEEPSASKERLIAEYRRQLQKSRQKEIAEQPKHPTIKEIEEYRKRLQESRERRESLKVSEPLIEKREMAEKKQEEPSPRVYEILERFQPIKRGEIKDKKRIRFFSSKRIKKILTAFLAAGIIIFGLVLYFILPKASVTLAVKKESVSLDLFVTADKNINKADPSLIKIPAQVIKTEKREIKEFSATGERYLEEKARGTITIYNAYSSSPQGLVVNTRFISTETGKLFRTTKPVMIPGAKVEDGKIIASTIDVEVMADEPGSEYNIGPSSFTIPGFKGSPKYEGFYGKSSAVMSGGAVGKKKIVLEEDFKNAEKVLLEELKKKLDQDLEGQLPENLKLLDGAIKEDEPELSFSHQANAPAEKFSIEGKLQTAAVVFDEEYINQIADLKVGASAQAQGKKVASGSRKISYDNWKIDFSKGSITMNVKIDQDLTWEIDPASLKEKLAGKNETEIKKILSQTPGIETAKVSFWPFWVKKMPTQLNRIEIIAE